MFHQPQARTGRCRIPGIEFARALAIIGMLSIHIGPSFVNTTAGHLYTMAGGRASVLFVLVAGVGVSLLASSRRVAPADARLRLAWRAMVLLPLGLALQELDIRVFVILQTYALLFVLAILVLGLRGRWLLVLAGAFALFGPLVFLFGEIQAPLTFSRDPASVTDPVNEIAHKLLLSGSYPIITWAAPFLLGIWLGRRNLRSKILWGALIAVGGVTALLTSVVSGALEIAYGGIGPPSGWARLIINTQHSQMPLWLLGSTGVAAMVLGLSLFLAHVFGRLAWPLVALGQLSLTVYVGHLFALHWWPDMMMSNDVGEAAKILLWVTVTASAVAMAWRRIFARGPLESVLHLPWQAAKWYRPASA